MASRMAQWYYKRVTAGLMSIDDVPTLWREEVRTMLEENEQNTTK